MGGEEKLKAEAALLCLALSPGNTYLAAGEDTVDEDQSSYASVRGNIKENRRPIRTPKGGRVLVWSGARLELIAALEGHDEGVTCVAWEPSGAVLASGGIDGEVAL